MSISKPLPRQSIARASRSPDAAADESSASKTHAGRTHAGRTYAGMSPQQRDHQRREQFLQAGIELFGTCGFRHTTVRNICQQAKLTDRYFYACCGSLEHLLMAVYEHCMMGLTRRVLSSLQTHYQDGDSRTAMRAALDAYFAELEDPRIARICMVELEGISPAVDQLYNNYIRGFGRIFDALAKIAYPRWNATVVHREVLGISLVGALRQSATVWLAGHYAIAREEMVSASMALFEGQLRLMEADNQDTASAASI